MKILDPVGDINFVAQTQERRDLDTTIGKRVGILWGQHAATAKFRPVFEEVAKDLYKPSEFHVLTKDSTWNPAEESQIQDLVEKVDFVIAGVGA